MSKHSHELAYFSLVLHGSYTETIGKTELSVRPAALVAHPPEHAHAVIFHCREVRIFRTEIQPPWLERLREHSVFFESPACFDGDIIAGLALRLYREFRAPDKYSPPAVEGILLEMLAEISRCEEQSAALRAPRWLERAREMLHEHATKILSPSEIATEVGVHPVHLAHEFRRFYRASIGEYARRLRVEAACREMAESDLPLSEIAANAGFYDQSHFSNVFKRHTGMTPTAFRSAVRTH
jgi:AraC family transcriptional regulator